MFPLCKRTNTYSLLPELASEPDQPATWIRRTVLGDLSKDSPSSSGTVVRLALMIEIQSTAIPLYEKG